MRRNKMAAAREREAAAVGGHSEREGEGAWVEMVAVTGGEDVRGKRTTTSR